MIKDTKPVKREFTKEQLVALAVIWTKANYGEFKEADPDKFFERMGMMVHFATDLMEHD